MKQFRMKCRVCGSENVLRDAWVEWNYEEQDWEIQNIFDDAYCEDCDGETNIECEVISNG